MNDSLTSWQEGYTADDVVGSLDGEQRATAAVVADLPEDLWYLERICAAVAVALEISYAEARTRVEQLFVPGLEALMTGMRR